MNRRKVQLTSWLLIGALIALLVPWPEMMSGPAPAQAQVGGSALPDTTRLNFKVFKIPKGQREQVSYSHEDSASCDSCTNKDLTVWGSFKVTGSWAPGGTVGSVFSGGTSASSFTPGQFIWYDEALKKLVASGAGSSTYQPQDADLDDLTDGSLSGSKVGSGIDAANITTGNLPIARVTSTDGSGSGLDADLLDGVSEATFARLDQAETISQEWQLTAAINSSDDLVDKNYVDTAVAGAGGAGGDWVLGGTCHTASTTTVCNTWDLDSYDVNEFVVVVTYNMGSAGESMWGGWPQHNSHSSGAIKGTDGYVGAGGAAWNGMFVRGGSGLGTYNNNGTLVTGPNGGNWKWNTSTNIITATTGSSDGQFAWWYR